LDSVIGICAMWRAEPTRDGAYSSLRIGKLVVIAFGEAGLAFVRAALSQPSTDQVAADRGRWRACDNRRAFTASFDDTGTPRSVARPFEIRKAACLTVRRHLSTRGDGCTMSWARSLRRRGVKAITKVDAGILLAAGDSFSGDGGRRFVGLLQFVSAGT